MTNGTSWRGTHNKRQRQRRGHGTNRRFARADTVLGSVPTRLLLVRSSPLQGTGRKGVESRREGVEVGEGEARG